FLGAVSSVISTWQAVRATRAAEAERLAKLDAEGQKTKAEQANDQAQKRLAQIEKGNEIITSIFTDLDIRQIKQGTEPLEAVLAQRLVKAAEQLEEEAVGDLLVVARLQERLGLTLLSLGHPQEAIKLFVKIRETRTAKLGADHPDTLTTMDNQACSYWGAGKLYLALPLWEEAFKLMKIRLGPDHPSTLTCMSNLAGGYMADRNMDLALPLFQESLRLRKAKLGADHPDTLT